MSRCVGLHFKRRWCVVMATSGGGRNAEPSWGALRQSCLGQASLFQACLCPTPPPPRDASEEGEVPPPPSQPP